MLLPGATVAEPLSPSLCPLPSGSYLPTRQAGRGGATGFSPILLSTGDQASWDPCSEMPSRQLDRFIFAVCFSHFWLVQMHSVKTNTPTGLCGSQEPSCQEPRVQPHIGSTRTWELWGRTQLGIHVQHPGASGLWVGVGEKKSLTQPSHHQFLPALWSRSLEQPRGSSQSEGERHEPHSQGAPRPREEVGSFSFEEL